MDTPVQVVPSFDQRATRWMSTSTSVDSSSWKVFQSYVLEVMPSVISSCQLASETIMVGPAVSTGKSLTTCCPGGTWSLAFRLRPVNPRVVTVDTLASVRDCRGVACVGW